MQARIASVLKTGGTTDPRMAALLHRLFTENSKENGPK
jgi:hypothetical protein